MIRPDIVEGTHISARHTDPPACIWRVVKRQGNVVELVVVHPHRDPTARAELGSWLKHNLWHDDNWIICRPNTDDPEGI